MLFPCEANIVTCLSVCDLSVCLSVCVCLSAGSGRVNRMSVLIARLPELKRANIEHCLIAAQVQQMSVAQVEMGMLWRELFLAAGHQTPDHI